jgi:hypothetical protein
LDRVGQYDSDPITPIHLAGPQLIRQPRCHELQVSKREYLVLENNCCFMGYSLNGIV